MQDSRPTRRIPPLDGALNFRDLGGYPAAGGRRVRWMTLYRSGTTHALTPRDVAFLETLGIRCAVDFRSNLERRQHPTRLTQLPGIDYRFRDQEGVPGDIRKLLSTPGARPEESHRLMIDLYRSLPLELAGAYGELFAQLAAGNLPLVFNCTAGKDRTGVAAALLLDALGVPRDEVLADYMATGQFYEKSCELILTEQNMALFPCADRGVWEPLMRVHEDYLGAMFERIDATHGGVAAYLEARLGIDDGVLERLHATLLEAAN
jgi:protein-tyrosine phosphatase